MNRFQEDELLRQHLEDEGSRRELEVEQYIERRAINHYTVRLNFDVAILWEDQFLGEDERLINIRRRKRVVNEYLT